MKIRLCVDEDEAPVFINLDTGETLGRVEVQTAKPSGDSSFVLVREKPNEAKEYDRDLLTVWTTSPKEIKEFLLKKEDE